MEKSHRPRQMALIHPKAFKLGGVQIGLIQQTKGSPGAREYRGSFMLTLYSDGLGGGRELPAIEIPIRLFRSVDHYKYATQDWPRRAACHDHKTLGRD